MKCKRCNKKLKFRKTICNHCGFDNLMVNSNEINECINKTNNKKSIYKKIILIIAIFLLFIIFIMSLFFMLISKSFKEINSYMNDLDEDKIIETYRTLQGNVKENILYNKEVACDDNCKKLYNYDDKIFDFEVKDMGDHYLLELELEYYIKLNDSYCVDLEDMYCHDNEIIGRVYKNEN